jgi:hypothetical protein
MFASVTASSSCEAALSLCTEIADCSVSVLACDGAENELFSTRHFVVVRNRRFQWLRVDVHPSKKTAVDEVFNELHAHFNRCLHTAKANEGFAHWKVDTGAERYDVTLIEQRDDAQKKYLSVSYYPGGL